MSDDSKKETIEEPAGEAAPQQGAPSGPTFNEGPDPLAGVKKSASDAMANMEGKTVSMKL